MLKPLKVILLLLSFSFGITQEVVYKGEWDNYSRWTTFEGSWQIVKSEEKQEIIFGDDFEAKKAPDLKIFFSKASLDDITSKNALKAGEPVFVAKLASYKGKATYTIPSSIDITKYKTVIVHCEEYSKLWGGSPLK